MGREKEEMRGDRKELKKRLEILEQNGRQEEGERQRWGEGEGKNMMDKIKWIEKSMESREREKRRRNIIKGMVAKKGNRREVMEEILEVTGAKVEIKEVRRIGEITEKGRGEMMLVKLENEAQKWEVMDEKRKI